MTSETAGIVPQPKTNSRYYKEGATWEQDRTRWERSKNVSGLDRRDGSERNSAGRNFRAREHRTIQNPTSLI